VSSPSIIAFLMLVLVVVVVAMATVLAFVYFLYLKDSDASAPMILTDDPRFHPREGGGESAASNRGHPVKDKCAAVTPARSFSGTPYDPHFNQTAYSEPTSAEADHIAWCKQQEALR
jgi:hypothetical protein